MRWPRSARMARIASPLRVSSVGLCWVVCVYGWAKASPLWVVLGCVGLCCVVLVRCVVLGGVGSCCCVLLCWVVLCFVVLGCVVL